MPLLALHTVELQCVLQFLPLADLLSFSQCSPAALAVTSAPFVFQHVEPVTVASPILEEALRRSSPFLRFTPLRVSVVWLPAAAVSVRAQLEAIAQAQLIVREFDASDNALEMELWQLILGCSWAGGLRTLKLHESGRQPEGRWDRATFELIAGLPQLERLHLIVEEPSRDLAPWSALVASTSLTHMTIDDRSSECVDEPFTLHAPNLTSLHLISPRLMGQRFDVFFAHKSMRQLRRLHLQGLFVESVLTGQVQAIAGMEQLVNLEEITLTEVICSDWLLDELHRLPALRLVSMQLHATSYSDTSLIPDETIYQLLRRSPGLHCEVRPMSRWREVDFFRSRWERFLRSPVFAEFGARLQIRSV